MDKMFMQNQYLFYRRHLPHYHPPHATFHVVFRLDGSLPQHVIDRLKAEKAKAEKKISVIDNQKQKHDTWREYQKTYFGKFDGLLDGSKSGPKWLRQPEIAGLVAEALRYRDGKQFDVVAYCIMPNHVHLVIENVGRDLSRPKRLHGRTEVRPTADPFYGRTKVRPTALNRVLRLLKGATARECNLVLKRRGSFWQHESYDHVIRDHEELEQTIWYVLFNPVKAGLVDTWQDWPWTYYRT